MTPQRWRLLPPAAEVAIKALVFFASQPRMATLGDAAKAAQCHISYLEAIFPKLKAAGIVQSKKGPGGGYRLTAPAETILLGVIIDAVALPAEPLYPQGLEVLRGQCENYIRVMTLSGVMVTR